MLGFSEERDPSRPTEIRPYRETGVALPLLHCVSCGIADYRCYTLTSFLKNGLLRSRGKPNKRVLPQKLASKAYRAI